MRNLWRTILDADPYWTFGAWTLLVAGILLLLYALFRDRPGLLGTPRERCTRCRYDMTGTAGPTDDQPEITCPECGRSYTSRKPLRKTRRHWKLVALALLLMLGRYAAIHKDRIRAYGWHELIPTAVVVLWIDPERWYHIRFEEANLERHWSDPVIRGIERRLDVAAGWERDVWIRRLRPSLDARGTWTELRISKIIDYQVETTYGSYGGWGGWYPGGPEVTYETYEDIEIAMYLIMILTGSDDWLEFGGELAQWYRIGDRIIVRSPASMLDRVRAASEYLLEQPRMPESLEDTSCFESKCVVRLPFDHLVPNGRDTNDSQPDLEAWLEKESQVEKIREALIRLVDTWEWIDMGGYDHQLFYFNNEFWILSSKDIRQQVIDAAHRIAAEGADKILENQSKD